MKKLFIYHPLFRILSPIFIGIIVYLLILLINNTTDQLQDQFLGQELYVCIGLAYLIQELSVLQLMVFKKYKFTTSEFMTLFLQILTSLILCIVVVSTAMTLYFKYALGFSPSKEELLVFNSIFSVICIIYISLYVSHQYLHRINTKKLTYELLRKKNIEDEFLHFEKTINPKLLFESLDALIILIYKNKEQSDDFLDALASVYRYILSTKNRELIPVNEELISLTEFVKLFNYLPYRKLAINTKVASHSLIVPNSLIFIVEQIIRSSIRSEKIELDLVLEESEDALLLKYKSADKVNDALSIKKLSKIVQAYKIYSDKKLSILTEDNIRTIEIPKLQTAPTS